MEGSILRLNFNIEKKILHIFTEITNAYLFIFLIYDFLIIIVYGIIYLTYNHVECY